MTNPKITYVNHPAYTEQECNLIAYKGDPNIPKWTIAHLITHAKDLPIFDCPLAALDLSHTSYTCNMRQMVGHMAACFDADPTCPILLDENGQILDGRHRIMRAIYEGKTTVPAKRFTTNPIPTSREPNE